MKAAPDAPGPSALSQIAFIVLMLGLTALFVTLGTWQLQRLGEKEAQIANVEARINDAPIAFPAIGYWADLDPDALDYRPYALTGTFDHDDTVLIFTNLIDPVGRYGGVGYWTMVPFVLEDGGIVWVNRGFVPEALSMQYANGGEDADRGTVTVEGVARRPEQAGMFTPAPDLAARREWVRTPERLNAFITAANAPVAPVTIDLVAGAPGDLPQGGETGIDFSNRHLEYAGTWYLFAAITPIMLGFWLWRQRRQPNLAHRDKAH